MSTDSTSQPEGATAVATKTKPAINRPRLLPPYKVMLHNDDKNTFEHVIATVFMLTPLNQEDAIRRTLEADKTGCSLLVVTHRERAELYQDQFQSASLTVTIEADE